MFEYVCVLLKVCFYVNNIEAGMHSSLSFQTYYRSIAEKQADPQNVILIGHSSGAQAALRYAELSFGGGVCKNHTLSMVFDFDVL